MRTLEVHKDRVSYYLSKVPSVGQGVVVSYSLCISGLDYHWLMFT